MSSRRSFIKSLGLLGLGSISHSSLKANQNFPSDIEEILIQLSSKHVQEDKNQYWKLIRQLFQLPSDYAYFNTGTVGISPLSVINTISKSIISNETYGYYDGEEEARIRLAKFVNVPKESLCLTNSTSEGLNIIIESLTLKPGDEVIISSHEHASHALPWLKNIKQKGIKLKVFNPQPSETENMEAIIAKITNKTKVIAIPHISCTIGTVYPIKKICDFARERNIYTIIDGAHSTGMINLNISELNCDFYASCCHKWLLGSKGTGYFYIRKELQDKIKPIFNGADSCSNWILDTEKIDFGNYIKDASRYEYGTKNAPLWKGVIAAIDLFEEIGMDNIEEHNRVLSAYLVNNLQQYPNKYELLSPEQPTSYHSIVGYKPKNISHLDYFLMAKKDNIRVRMVNESNLNSIRISTHIYNNKNEIDRLLNLI